MRKVFILAMLAVLFLGMSVTAMTYSEAPELAERVASGELPPVEQRLPNEPVVVEPLDFQEIGQYGGQWRMALLGAADGASYYYTVHSDPIMQWYSDESGVFPNLIKDYDSNEDASEFIFYLHEGIKWSDGTPHTADDYMFTYNSVWGNSELSPSGPPTWMRPGGEPVVVTKIDDYTVKFSYSQPNGLFLLHLATSGGVDFVKPAHFLKQYHADFVDKAELDQMVSAGGYATWVELYEDKQSHTTNPERPVFWPWQVVVPIGEGSRVVWERNPYYWKVDPQGQQLPYLDRVIFEVIDNVEVMRLQAMAGDIDFQIRHMNHPPTLPLFVDNVERGDYRIIRSSKPGGVVSFQPNNNHLDPAMRAIIDNRDFRYALSHALNRQEIIDVQGLGLGIPMQAVPFHEGPFYNERKATIATEYDPDLANELLDRVGLDQRDSEGYRLRPDGEPFVFNVEVAIAFAPHLDQAEMAVEYWRAVGIRANLRTFERSLFYERKSALEHDMTVWGAGGESAELLLDPRHYLPFNQESNWARGYAEWFMTGGSAGEEPTGDYMKVIELYNDIVATADSDEHIALMQEILEIGADNLWNIGTFRASQPLGFGIVKNGFMNVSDTYGGAWPIPFPGIIHPELFFWK